MKIVNVHEIWQDYDAIVSRAAEFTALTAEELNMATAEPFPPLLLFKVCPKALNCDRSYHHQQGGKQTLKDYGHFNVGGVRF